MKKYVVLFALCLWIHSQGTPPAGYEIFTIKSEATGNASLKIVLIDQAQYRASVFGITQKRQTGVTALELVLDNGAAVALGSGFVTSFSPLIPNGFLKIEGRVISKVNTKGYSGIIGVDLRGMVRLLPATAFNAIETLREGFQVGPTLIKDGEVQKLNTNYHTRAFCGLTRDNKVVIGISLDRMDLNALARFLANPPETFRQLKCVTALNLAGGGSEALVVERKQVQEGNYDLKCASVVGFRRR